MAQTNSILSRCVSIDIEVDPKTNRILRFAAVRPKVKPFEFQCGRGRKLTDGLQELDRYASAAQFVVGHNFIAFDRPLIESTCSTLRLLSKPVIDTLWLNPLAFPRNPYHCLVKHYHGGSLVGGNASDPRLDAELALEVLRNQFLEFEKLRDKNPRLLKAFHWLTAGDPEKHGFSPVFSAIRDAPKPSVHEAREGIGFVLGNRGCSRQIESMLAGAAHAGWPLAYALSWISVSGGDAKQPSQRFHTVDSVLPSWVRHQFPDTGRLIRRLRDTVCDDSACSWCQTQYNPTKLLTKWFGFESYRQKPVGADGRPLQEVIVANALAKTSTLGILPTGTGKSVCYQLPALAQYDRTGALTVAISPLVALMADQVGSLKREGIHSCVTVNGMLSLPERHDALEQVRLGSAAILLISPEQLRSPSVSSALLQREIGYWVFDEAHCISKWGHDFRPDYRYAARFIKEHSSDGEPAPLICLTATANPGVIKDVREHFRVRLGVTLELIDGGATRDNLEFSVIKANKATKLGKVAELLEAELPRGDNSGAIVYCATRSAAKRVAGFLRERGFAASHYHAGLTPEIKKDVQNGFSEGELRVIVATNAFGMGIDKPDIRLVVHVDIPGSLENYLQEAGRAGRDREPAKCMLLYEQADIERQFDLSARSRLDRREIVAVLKSIRRLDRRFKRDGEVFATPGEILREETDRDSERGSDTDDTRVKIAVAWLEEAALLRRDENRTQVFPSSLKVQTLTDANVILESHKLGWGHANQLLKLVEALMNAPADAGISTDELCGLTGFRPARLRKALADMESLGIMSNDIAITIYAHFGVRDSSARRLDRSARMEADLIGQLRELAPDLAEGEFSRLNLRFAAQALRDQGHKSVRPDLVETLIRGIARDGRNEEDGIGSFQVRKINRDHIGIRLQRTWDKLVRTAELRRKGASVVLSALAHAAPAGERGKDIQVETTIGCLIGALREDLELASGIKDISKFLDRSLLWLHEQAVVALGRGLTVFRPAMTIRVSGEGRGFTESDFEPLRIHYDQKTLQTHIMAEYAERGLKSMSEATSLAEDYFQSGQQDFVEKWLPKRSAALKRQTTPESWRRIVEKLGNPVQSRIVTDNREQTNVLVLAGPGSGKTRILVHRIAFLVRVRRENPSGILALAYNRHAAKEIRDRLVCLIGDDARGVTIQTCHGLAMRLVGASFTKRFGRVLDCDFDRIVSEAASLLRGDSLAKDEAESQRETLLRGYRWILVDEYQDIGKREYELIAAVAGRSTEDEDSRLSLFAVGDDDQNIYAFTGASVKFIRDFEADYAAKPVYLVENYRSTANIINAANSVIAPAADRMKVGHDIIVNRMRKREPSGGDLEQTDIVGRGRVQILKGARNESEQAVIAMRELQRLAGLVPDWDWREAAVIAREWRFLQPVRAYCEARNIPVQSLDSDLPNIWRLAETQSLIDWLRVCGTKAIGSSDLLEWIDRRPNGPWWSLLKEGVDEFTRELGSTETDPGEVGEWFAEWSQGARQRQYGLLLLSAHRAKGLEFKDVVVLDGGWDRISKGEDPDASRRLYYVAMTRAKRSLALVSISERHRFARGNHDPSFLVRRVNVERSDLSSCEKVFETLTPQDVDLGYAGRLHDGNPALRTLDALQSGSPIGLKPEGHSVYLVDSKGIRVGKLAKKYRTPKEMRFVEGKVYAMLRRRREDSEPEYRNCIRRDQWWVVIPELVFQHERQAGREGLLDHD